MWKKLQFMQGHCQKMVLLELTRNIMKMIQGQRQKYRQRTIPNITSATQRDLTGNFENSIPDDDDYIFYLRSINAYYCGICSYF